MSFSLLFADSFDHYNTPGDKWTDPQSSSIDLTGTQSRTGIGAMLLSSAGPGITKAIPQGNTFVVGVAYKTNGGNNSIFGFKSPGTGTKQVTANINPDGSISALANGTQLGITIGGLVPSNLTYIYVEMAVVINGGGSVVLRVNGQEVLNLTNVNTDPDHTGLADAVFIQGPGGGTFAYADDFYCGTGNDFQGAVRIYAEPPTADSTPLQWTPSSGTTHFNLVNEVPPDGDTSYVFDNTIGDQDQYLYPVTGPVPPVVIRCVQHCLDARIDIAGSRLIGSCVGAVNHGSQALTNNYQIKCFQYDVNPVTGVPWTLADFGTLPFGPVITG